MGSSLVKLYCKRWVPEAVWLSRTASNVKLGEGLETRLLIAYVILPDGKYRNHMGVAHSYCYELLVQIIVGRYNTELPWPVPRQAWVWVFH